MGTEIRFTYTRQPTRADFGAYCGGTAEALAVVQALPTLCGASFIQTDDYLSVSVPLDRLEEAIFELETAGYLTVDGDPSGDEESEDDENGDDDG